MLSAECIRCTDGLGRERRRPRDARGRAGRTSTGQRLATESARQARVRSPAPLGGGSGESGGWPCGEVSQARGVRSARGTAWLRRRLTREGAVEHTRVPTHAHEDTHEHAHPGAGALSQGAGRDEGETAARGGGGRVGGAVALHQVWRPVWRQAGRRAATGGDEWGRQAKVAASALQRYMCRSRPPGTDITSRGISAWWSERCLYEAPSIAPSDRVVV